MGNTIQIVIAGLLILAWIWVLGRPLMAKAPTPYEEFLANNPDRVPERSRGEPAAGRAAITGAAGLGSVRNWWNRPAEVWRRQLLLASLLAAFISFLLAVALRTTAGNTFLYLFALMLLGLAIHLVVAARLGRRMLEQRQAVAASSAARAKARPGAMSIKAETAGGLHPQEPDSAFDMAADLASALGQEKRSAAIDRHAEVSGLIENEWGDDDVPPPGVEAGDAEGAEASSGGTAGSQTSGSQTAAGGDAADPSPEGPGEPLFRRAAVNEPSRSSKRKPKPIYIESQLDEGDDGPKAVNFP